MSNPLIDEKYLCKVCKRINVEPYQSSCGCRYCENCKDMYDQCPVCDENTRPCLKDKAFKNDIEKVLTRCQMCDWKGKLVALPEHCYEEHIFKNLRICDINLNDTQARSATLVKTAMANRNEMETLKADLAEWKRKTENLEKKFEKTQEELQTTQKSLLLMQTANMQLEERLNSLKNISKNGMFIWKITNFTEKFTEAKSGIQTNLYSAPFFTSEYGYKLCAKVYLNGDSLGKDTHLSIFVSLMKGSYDNLLKWPFRQKITFMLLDQAGRQNVVDAFRPDPNSRSFQKPVNEMNIASGIPLFCSHLKLFSSEFEYIKNDCIFIKILVDTRDLMD